MENSRCGKLELKSSKMFRLSAYRRLSTSLRLRDVNWAAHEARYPHAREKLERERNGLSGDQKLEVHPDMPTFKQLIEEPAFPNVSPGMKPEICLRNGFINRSITFIKTSLKTL